MDYEVHTLQSVTGFGTAQAAEQKFLPLYATFHESPHGHGAYYTARREPRLLSSRQRREGPPAHRCSRNWLTNSGYAVSAPPRFNFCSTSAETRALKPWASSSFV